MKDQKTMQNSKANWYGYEPIRVLSKSMILAMQSKNMTGEQLSTLTGISKKKLSKMICGKANPRLSTLCKIANALDMTISLVPKQEKVSSFC